VRLRVPAPELSTLQARVLSYRATRATQKVRETEPMQEKSKGKGKVKVIDKAVEEVWKEKVAKLKAEITVNIELIAQLEG
jgi:ribosomal protein L31E